MNMKLNDTGFIDVGGFIDLPPADHIAYDLEKLANPKLTYSEYVKRWQEATYRIRNKKNN